MSGIRLDERLALVAELVRPGSVVADVGCDHGYLVCHLVAGRKCPRAFACDIAPGPLSKARSNIAREGLDARIITLQCNGLSGVPCDAVGDVVIAGMGGDLIAKIMLDWEGSRDPEKQFILNPMSKPEHLRRELYRNGFVLYGETPVICGNFVYTVMVARYTGLPVDVSPHFCYTGKIWELKCGQAAVAAYLRWVHGHICKKAEGYAQSAGYAARAAEFAEIRLMLEERLREAVH